ncbi:MAG: MFS transporter [Dehalococcoidia bacterium]|nr:MFS transporter [Dehalococcoidia bacterium]
MTVGFQFQSVASVSPPLMDDLDIGHGEVGTLIGLFMLPGVVIALPAGMLLQRFDDKLFLGFGLLLLAAGGVVFALASGFPLAVAGRIVRGVGAVTMIVTITKVVTDQFAGKEIGTALAIMATSWPLGIAAGLVSQDSIAGATSWQFVMLLTSGVNLAALVLLITVVRLAPPTAAVTESGKPGFMIPSRELLLVCLAGIAWGFFNAGFAIHFSFTPDLLSENGMSSTEAKALVSVGVWITMLSIPFGGYFVEKVGRSNAMIAIFSLLVAATLGLFPYLSIPLALSVVIGLALGPPPGPLLALPSQALSVENRGIGLGIFYTWFYAFMALGPTVAGFGRDITDSADTPVLMSALAFVLVVPFLGAFRFFHARTPGG